MIFEAELRRRAADPADDGGVALHDLAVLHRLERGRRDVDHDEALAEISLQQGGEAHRLVWSWPRRTSAVTFIAL